MSLNLPSNLPAQLRPLVPLAYNLRWSWHAPARELFERADPALWAATGHNPVRLLADLSPARLVELAADGDYAAAVAAASEDLAAYLGGDSAWFRRERSSEADLRVAYFSAEFAITECLPIASGGLGVLAGDHLKSASDLGIPLVAVGLFYGEGYFTQRVDRTGWQYDSYTPTSPSDVPLVLERRPDGSRIVVTMPFLDHKLHAQVWRADIGRNPLYLLDTNIPENLIARVQFIRKSVKNAVSLPKEAILTNEVQTAFWIMKMIGKDKAVKVLIEKGIESNDLVEIRSPKLLPTDQILLTGNYGLPDTANVSVSTPSR